MGNGGCGTTLFEDLENGESVSVNSSGSWSVQQLCTDHDPPFDISMFWPDCCGIRLF
ncbi:hypothetical protein CE91St46_24440 [Eubacteriales bacterium]|nr:hypothetical protein CE91St46_24440 [Eubacteriales bacterium]GKH64052.1 hypothetical protein CE91St47_25210 [Eubacteriales bacterium]